MTTNVEVPHYKKKFALKISSEYTQSTFTWVLSLAITLIFLFNSFDLSDGSMKPVAFTFFAAYAFFTIVQLVITRLIPEAEGTTCDQRLEPIDGTRNARILRIPFRDGDGHVIPQWISRFHVWPYLERFAIEAQREFRKETGQNPDFIIGNYSDGNLVASIMAGLAFWGSIEVFGQARRELAHE